MSGLLYYGMRYYQQGIGRWLSRDPAGEAFSLNRYCMVKNDPINTIDILGLADYVLGSSDPQFALEKENPWNIDPPDPKISEKKLNGLKGKLDENSKCAARYIER